MGRPASPTSWRRESRGFCTASPLIGYARVSTDEQDLTVQRNALAVLGVSPERTYVDHGLTGTNRERPGLREALAACRAGDTFVVTKLDRLARSLPDAREIIDDLTRRQVTLSLGGSLHDPTDPIGRLLFNVLAMVAEFESDLIRLRTREGMKVAKAKGRLRGKQPKLNSRQVAHLVALATTAPPSSETFSESGAPLCTEPSSATRCASGPARRPVSRPRPADGSACGPSAASAAQRRVMAAAMPPAGSRLHEMRPSARGGGEGT